MPSACPPSTLPEHANLAAIDRLREFTTHVGWSDHTVCAQVVDRAVRFLKGNNVSVLKELEQQEMGNKAMAGNEK